MVSALSEAVINTLFADLKTEETIKKVWSFRFDIDERDTIQENSGVFNENFPTDTNPGYEEVKGKFDEAFAQPRAQNIRMQGFIAEIGDPSITILENSYSELLFNIPFKIGKMTRTFYFDNPPENTILDGITYVFKVQIGKISSTYPSLKNYTEAAKKNLTFYMGKILKQYLQSKIDQIFDGYEGRDKEALEKDINERMDKIDFSDVEGVNTIFAEVLKVPEFAPIKEQLEKITLLQPEDFLIESLFLNFETADFIADSAYTIQPDPKMDIGAWSKLQELIQLYFKDDLNSNPYVLGYGVTVPELVKLEPAILQPTSLNFSASFVAAKDKDGKEKKNPQGEPVGDPKESSVNYLMMTTGKAPRIKGIDSLLDSSIDSSSALGIEFNLFYDKYLEKISEYIGEKLSENNSNLARSESDPQGVGFNFSQSDGSIKVTGGLEIDRDYLTISFGSQQIDALMFRINTSITSGGRFYAYKYKKNITLTPMIEMEFRDDKIILNFQLRMDIEYDSYDNPGKKNCKSTNFGIEGTTPQGLIITLSCGTKGSFDCTIEEVANKEVCYVGNNKAEGIVNKSIDNKSFFDVLSSKKFLDNLRRGIEKDFNTLPNVVLPLGNVFLYKKIVPKEVMIQIGDKQTKIVDTVNFSSTYAPEF